MAVNAKKTYTESDIIEALHVILDVCTNAKDCDVCPLGTSGGDCKINIEVPEDWCISDLKFRRLLG